MGYTYVGQEDGLEQTGGWIRSRAWQMREDGEGQKLPVMVHKLYANNNDLELIVSRCHDEARRTLFKVSNLPEAALSTSCLVDYFKEPREAGYAYCIATSGWHGKTLGDLFGSGEGVWKKYGANFRERLKEPSQRRLFWQAFTPIAQLLRRLQEAKMFLPELDLDSLCFLAESEEEFQEQEDGHFSPDSLRLVGLERIVPFGVRLRSGQGDAPTTLSTPPVQILTWRSLAGVIIDTFFGAPPSAWPDEKKHEHRRSATTEKMRANQLSSEEYTLLSDMLHARDDFALGNVCAAFERLCYSLPANKNVTGRGPNLTVVYNRRTSHIQDLVDGDDFGCPPRDAQINAYLEQKLADATVWLNPDELHSNSSLTLHFECGPTLWFKAVALKSEDAERYNTSIILLQHQMMPLAPYKKENLLPVSLHNTRLHCFARHQQQHQSHNGNDWVPMLKSRISYARHEKIRDKQLAVLSTLEMTNQLESLMAFLNLFVCRVEEVKSESDKVVIRLAPLDDSMWASAPLDCMERLTKIRQIQDKIRDIIGQTGAYPDQMFRYLLEQHDQHTGAPEHRRRNEDLLITDWNTAGSLSVNIGGSKNLDAISWRVSDWEALQEQGRIMVSRVAPLSAQERNVICAGKLVSVRTRGYYGQMEVIKRRTDAFEHLGKYEMLMQQLVEPTRKTGDDSTLDGGQFRARAEETLYQNVPEDRRLDDNKMAIIQDACLTMPLFVLQGPPGTGKSETVCALSKLLFNEDPMVQILMTSRENATVKELLAKLHAESRNWPSMPIFRLSRKIQDSLLGRGRNADEDEQSGFAITADDQLRELLEQARQKRVKEYQEARTEEICAPWNAFLAAHAAAGQDALAKRSPCDPDEGRGDAVAHDAQDRSSMQGAEIEAMIGLMEQSANFAFTTASDKGLADMVAEGLMYDWAFVEEAGKTPFYDLILPMLVSQRWFLLGDPQQLKPFQSREFMLLMEKYDEVVELLTHVKKLGQNGRKDYVSLRNIEQAIDRDDPHFFERSWIEPFRKIFEAIGSRELGRTEANGETSAILNVVYRLPPVITELVSVFYKGLDLKPADQTRDIAGGQFAPSESKSNPLAGPTFLTGANAIWLNTQTRADFCQQEKDRQVWNQGEAKLISQLLQQCRASEGKPSLAILTPYRKQVQELVKHLEPLDKHLSKTFTPAVQRGSKRGWVSTIDAFQGCQADVVILSLVRCSSAAQDEEKGKIGFIAEENRVNVMISRCKRLLLIVGSLDYFKACHASSSETSDDAFRQFLDRYQEMAADSRCSAHLKIIDCDLVADLCVPLREPHPDGSRMPFSSARGGHNS